MRIESLEQSAFKFRHIIEQTKVLVQKSGDFISQINCRYSMILLEKFSNIYQYFQKMQILFSAMRTAKIKIPDIVENSDALYIEY